MQRTAHRLPHVPPLKATAALLLLPWLGTPAQAEYRYTYTGNPFTMTTQQYYGVEPGDPLEGRSFSLQSISAEVYTTTPLTAGTTAGNVLRFTVSLIPASPFEQPRTLTYPSIYTPPYPCSFCEPMISGSLSIGAVGATGLPTDWNLWISFDQANPTGRHEMLTLTTTQTLDRVSGGYEGFVSYSGGLVNSPGYWTLALAVPEPWTPALLLAGIAALAARQRHSRPATATL